MISVATQSPEQTIAVAAAFAGQLQGGEVISLEGGLGAGKTCFVRGIAEALRSPDAVSSPTFVLQKIYRAEPGNGVASLVHYDVYRIGTYAELADLGFEDLPDNAVAIVEWGDRFAGDFPILRWRVALEITGPEARIIRFRSDGGSEGDLADLLAASGFESIQGSPASP